MFELFTEAARKTVFYARQEANLLGNPEIEPEHLLLGILRVDEPLLQRSLGAPGSVAELRTLIELYCKAKGGKAASLEAPEPPLSAASKRVLSRAEEEMKILRDQEIGAIHLLRGILREASSYAATSLRGFGVVIAEVTREIGAEGGFVRGFPSGTFRPMRDLTAAAAEGQFAPLIGREREFDRLLHILLRRQKNDVALVGEPGVGKTALVEGLATRLASGALPRLSDRRLLSVDAALLGGSHPRHPARRLNLARNTIVCIEGLPDMGLAGALSSLEPGPAASDPERKPLPAEAASFQCIATGTPAGFRRFAERFGALARRFEVVELAPNTPDEAIAILQGLKARYEKFHGVDFADDAIPAAVHISGRTLPQRHLPDRALDLLDDAGARTKLRGASKVTAVEIAQAAAENAGMPVAALERVLALHKPLEFEVVSRELASRLPADQHAWLRYLAAYLAGCPPAAAEELAQGIHAAIASLGALGAG